MVTIDADEVNRSEVARRTNYTLGHISRIFSGQRRPSIKCAGRIAEALGMSLDDFWAWYKREFGEE